MTEENIVVVPCGTVPISSGSFNPGSSYYANMLEVLNSNPSVTGVVTDALVNYEYLVPDTKSTDALMKAKTALELAGVLNDEDHAGSPIIIKINGMLAAIRDAAFNASDTNNLLTSLSVAAAVDTILHDIEISVPSDSVSGRVVITIPEKYIVISGVGIESKTRREERTRAVLASRPEGLVYTISNNTVRPVARGTGSINRPSVYVE